MRGRPWVSGLIFSGGSLSLVPSFVPVLVFFKMERELSVEGCDCGFLGLYGDYSLSALWMKERLRVLRVGFVGGCIWG
jgi:hypothetical protein